MLRFYSTESVKSLPDLLCKIGAEELLALSRIMARIVGERQLARQLLQGEGIQKVQFKMRLGEDDSLGLTPVLNKPNFSCPGKRMEM